MGAAAMILGSDVHSEVWTPELPIRASWLHTGLFVGDPCGILWFGHSPLHSG